MLMNAETLEFVSLAAVSISREVTSVPAPRDTPRVRTENPVLVRTLPVRKLTDLKQLCKPCYLMKSLVLNILSIVSDQREGNCFLELIGGRCVPTYFYRMTNQECCCSGAAAWGPTCSRCPAQGSSKLMIELALYDEHWWYWSSQNDNLVLSFFSLQENLRPCVLKILERHQMEKVSMTFRNINFVVTVLFQHILIFMKKCWRFFCVSF